MIHQRCDVCGKREAVQIACSAYGAVVSCIACAGHFPKDIRREYVEDVHRMLPLWDKTEEEFIRDVETMIEKEKEESPCL